MTRGAPAVGWVAATKHRTPWASAPDGPLDKDKWELYHVVKDFTKPTTWSWTTASPERS